jgi:putative FmdB family regulatory protein
MPIYEYQCDGCGQVFELLQKYSDPQPEKHDCGSTNLHRIMSSTAFIFKGSGWYITDYARKGKGQSEGSSGGSSESKSSESKSSESKSSDSKPAESKPASKPTAAA